MLIVFVFFSPAPFNLGTEQSIGFLWLIR